MSYSIITKTKNGIISEIPISTKEYFHEYWIPLFERHKLINLSNWKFPHDLERNELKELIKEWEKLLPNINGEWEKERADFILEKLKEINYENYEYISFG